MPGFGFGFWRQRFAGELILSFERGIQFVQVDGSTAKLSPPGIPGGAFVVLYDGSALAGVFIASEISVDLTQVGAGGRDYGAIGPPDPGIPHFVHVIANAGGTLIDLLASKTQDLTPAAVSSATGGVYNRVSRSLIPLFTQSPTPDIEPFYQVGTRYWFKADRGIDVVGVTAPGGNLGPTNTVPAYADCTGILIPRPRDLFLYECRVHGGSASRLCTTIKVDETGADSDRYPQSVTTAREPFLRTTLTIPFSGFALTKAWGWVWDIAPVANAGQIGYSAALAGFDLSPELGGAV